jgi:putative ABC transport system permease protein
MASGFALSTYQALSQASARDTGHLIIAKPAQFDGNEDSPLQYGLDDAAALRQRLLADPQVRQVLPRVEFGGLISNGEKSVVMMGVGVEPDNEFAVKGPFLMLQAGQVLASGSDRGQVMLGEGLARSLKAKPGTSLTLLATTVDGALNAIDVQVRGVFSTGVPEKDQRLIYTDVALAQQLLGSQRVSSLGVFLDRMESTAGARERLAAQLPASEVRTWEQQAPFYRAVQGLYNRIFGTLGLIIGAIVMFAVVNAMSMAIVERTREIGTLRALGTLPGQLIRAFALEGMVLGGVGALVGAGLALAASLLLLLVPVQMPPPPGRSQGYPLLLAVDPLIYLSAVVAMVLCAMLVSAWVARHAVRIPVVDALSHT